MHKVLSKFLGSLCVIIMISLLLIVCWQVLSRYALSSPSTVSEELARLLLMWLGLFGAAYTSSQNGHMSIDILSLKLSPKQNKVLKKVIQQLSCVFAMVMILGGYGIIKNVYTLGQTTPVLGIPMGHVYLAIPLSGLFILYFLIRDFIGEN